jgi:phage replication O-like protein O
MTKGTGNPQLEDGFARIPNEILEAIARTSLSDCENRCIHFLWRKTYGWTDKNGQPKKNDVISISQWSEGTGIEHRNAVRILNSLVNRKIFNKEVIEQPNKNKITIWSFQNNYFLWVGYKAKPVAEQTPLPPQPVANEPLPTHKAVDQNPKAVANQPLEVVAGETQTKDTLKINTKDMEMFKKILDIFKTLKTWEFEEKEDFDWLIEFYLDFPELTLDDIKSCRDLHSTQPTKTKGPWKNRFRQWMKNGKKYPQKIKEAKSDGW